VITGVRVRAWVEARRSDYQAGALTPDRIAALEGISGWSWHARTTRWDRGMHAAKTHIARHGNLTTCVTTVVDRFALGCWITRLRADHRAGSLTPEQIDTLQALPGWVWATPGEQSWRRGVGYLRAYIAEHGSADPPLSVVVDTFALGCWVAARRRNYHAGTLRADRVDTLQALPGWSWQPHQQRWHQRLAELRRLVGVHGTLSAACTTAAGNPRLAGWVRTQRAAYRGGTLAPERIHALEALPGWKWAPRQTHTPGQAKPSFATTPHPNPPSPRCACSPGMEFIPDTVIAHRGRVIKNLGDEVLFVTDDAASAAQIALRLLEEIDTVSVSTRTGPGARGACVRSRAPPQRRRLRPVVNIAARIARQGTVRADTAMATALADSTEFTLAAPAPRPRVLQLRTYRLRRTHPQVPMDRTS